MDSLLQKSVFSKVTYHISANEPVKIKSYAIYWFQILECLLANSAEHGFDDRKGEVTITIDVRFDRVIIAFLDNGSGIAEDKVNNVFEPFSTSKRNQGHLGLGLHVIFNLVTQTLKGSIRYVKNDNQGACFIIELPIELPMQRDVNSHVTPLKS
jgi:C4-dicarboxylate-specific signal transduction histidine kinase